MTDELTEIMDQHSEILFSAYPYPTWKGLLKIETCVGFNLTEHMKIKLIVPKYPLLQDAELYLDPKIASLPLADIQMKINKLLSSANSVSSLLLLTQVQIGSLIAFARHFETEVDFLSKSAVRELHNVLSSTMEIQLSSTRCLTTIVLSKKDISLMIKRIFGVWKIATSDFSNVLKFDNLESVILIKIVENFIEKATILDQVFNQFKEIDKNCWIIDPVNPKSYHLYRRIYLDHLFSITITVNPLQLSDRPDIKFLGNEEKVKEWENCMAENLNKNWQTNCSLYENLKNCLRIDEFPKAPAISEVKQNSAIVTDEECCICYLLQLENGLMPDKVCNNERCRRVFHSLCLFEWLQRVTENNKIIFNEIQGECVHCGEAIVCPVMNL